LVIGNPIGRDRRQQTAELIGDRDDDSYFPTGDINTAIGMMILINANPLVVLFAKISKLPKIACTPQEGVSLSKFRIFCTFWLHDFAILDTFGYII